MPGVYSIRISICDGTSSAYSTLTLTILPSPADLLVVKKTGRPGKLRIVNKNASRVQFLWGANDIERKDGSIRIRKGRSKVITAHRRSLVWLVRTRRESGLGITRGIRLPAQATPLPPGAPPGLCLAEIDAAWMTRDPKSK